MPEEIEGLQEVLKNLKKAEDDIVAGVVNGMKAATLETEAHIVTGYQRSVTGKGFDNRTGRLRASIGQAVRVTKTAVIGYVFAGTHYAVYVEHRWSGKYAFLWPGVKDMKRRIWELIGAKGAIK